MLRAHRDGGRAVVAAGGHWSRCCRTRARGSWSQSPEPQAAVAHVLGGLGTDEDDELTARYRHVQEVRTGYQHGCAELALDGEPRPQYAPGVPMMARYQAKAAELGVG